MNNKSKTICVDGNTATANIAYKLSEVAAIYPITPSSTMAELASKMSDDGKLNIFGSKMIIKEMQSEAGASGAVHGSLTCGALSTTFTASQGLLLMIPNMYKIAGELLPCVFHVSARALATHALSIFGDHSDVMAVRQTGFAMIASSSVQECEDMALASHIATLTSSVPFVHFFDGFRTSHEIQKIESIDDEDIKKIYPFDKLKEFKSKALDPINPVQKGTAQNPDIFFQNREACNLAYSKVYENVVDAFSKIEAITNRHYEPFEYYGADDAENIIVIMGSGSETVIKTVNQLNKEGHKVGVIKVRLFRPFNAQAFINKLPKSTKRIAVLDRTKESTSPAEPLCEDVICAVQKNGAKIEIVGGRYGLGSKEFTPSDVFSVFENLKKDIPTDHFSVGIFDDVTHLSLPQHNYDKNEDCTEYKFFGLGSDGTVSANKNTIKIIGEETDNFVQGYFEYDSKKSGSLTTSHLRVSKFPIQSPYLLQGANFIAIHNFSFVGRYDLTNGLKQNGTVLINTAIDEKEICKFLPKKFIDDIKTQNAKLFIIDAQKIADKLGLGGKINIIMQTAFFKLSNVIDYSLAKEKMIEAIKNTYGKKGDNVVNMNISAINETVDAILQVELSDEYYKQTENSSENEYYEKFIKPIESLKGNELPVSSFNANGSVPTDTSKFLKRGVASKLPCWQSEKCIQCGFCALACPHSVIKAKLFDEKEISDAPESFVAPNALGVVGKKYKLQISPLDCTGCGVCSKVCPAKEKALIMKDANEILEKEKQNLKYFNNVNSALPPFPKNTPKGLQFEKSYFEFSGACAGCGETPYIELISKLFGKDMIIANATGCSSIYGGNSPVCPYAKDSDGNGPAWANSLFEDNAEFGYGMRLAVNNNKENLKQLCNKSLDKIKNDDLKNILNQYILNDEISHDEYKKAINLLNLEPAFDLKSEILSLQNYFTKKSVWIIGGDGWAYDIGYGGLDHIIASNENVNILVLDSEVYSNTGGQASKSTQKGATAKFASSGKETKKKDLGYMAMSYKNAYVASISLGADPMQAIKAIKEAESYRGPSLIIAYSPCVNHGFDMSNSNNEMKKAVLCGYWNLYRFNPSLEKPLTIDSKEPTIDFKNFLLGESRYSALTKANPNEAERLFKECEEDAIERRRQLIKLLDQ